VKTSISIIVTVLLFAGFLVLSAKADDKKMAGFFHKAGEKAAEEGNDEEAVKQFRMALKCDPNHSGAVISLARVYARKLEPTSIADLYKTWLDAMKNVSNPGKEQRAIAKQIKSEMMVLTELV
jgi:Tfp pilus assembly protein PilF